jgi:hypothetical protein
MAKRRPSLTSKVVDAIDYSTGHLEADLHAMTDFEREDAERMKTAIQYLNELTAWYRRRPRPPFCVR